MSKFILISLTIEFTSFLLRHSEQRKEIPFLLHKLVEAARLVDASVLQDEDAVIAAEQGLRTIPCFVSGGCS